MHGDLPRVTQQAGSEIRSGSECGRPCSKSQNSKSLPNQPSLGTTQSSLLHLPLLKINEYRPQPYNMLSSY